MHITIIFHFFNNTFKDIYVKLSHIYSHKLRHRVFTHPVILKENVDPEKIKIRTIFAARTFERKFLKKIN